MRHNVMAEPLFPGSSTTYEQTVRVYFESYVFPRGLKFKGEGIDRDNVIVEQIERDGNSWWIKVRARYSGRILGIGVAERARVEYDNGNISVDLGGLKGVLNTGGIAPWLSDVLGKHPDSGADQGQQPVPSAPVSGDLLWYRHDSWQDGAGSWAGDKLVGHGWQQYESVFAGSDGVLYGIMA